MFVTKVVSKWLRNVHGLVLALRLQKKLNYFTPWAIFNCLLSSLSCEISFIFCMSPEGYLLSDMQMIIVIHLDFWPVSRKWLLAKDFNREKKKYIKQYSLCKRNLILVKY